MLCFYWFSWGGGGSNGAGTPVASLLLFEETVGEAFWK